MSNERRPAPSATSNGVVIDLTDDDSDPPNINELFPSVTATSSVSPFSTGYGTIVAASASASAGASTIYTNDLYETHRYEWLIYLFFVFSCNWFSL
jgi:hypothetical protein